jgi:hypothetical protein
VPVSETRAALLVGPQNFIIYRTYRQGARGNAIKPSSTQHQTSSHQVHNNKWTTIRTAAAAAAAAPTTTTQPTATATNNNCTIINENGYHNHPSPPPTTRTAAAPTTTATTQTTFLFMFCSALQGKTGRPVQAHALDWT